MQITSHQDYILLNWLALSVGFIHTILGPDHYLPFSVMSNARGWSYKKTIVITILCGFGHISSSIILGIIGLLLGIPVSKLSEIESVRGGWAGWLMIAFGAAYLLWGVRKAIIDSPHTHKHTHNEGEHAHVHNHSQEHSHVHDHYGKKKDITPWIFFTIFVLGPCEPLIPILIYPAAKGDISLIISVILLFGVATIITMTGIVSLSFYAGGNSRSYFLLPHRFNTYSHAISGGMILFCGLAMQFLGV